MKHSDFIKIISNKGYWFSTVIGFILGLVSILYSTNIFVPIFVVALIIFISLAIIWYLIIIIISQKQIKPTTIQLSQFFSTGKNHIILIKPNDILSMDAYITLYLTENECENYLATAIVTNVQENRLLQAKIIDWDSNSRIKQEALHNDVSLIRKISIKPIITDRFLGGNYNG